MKYKIRQSVQLLGVGIPGVITKAIPELFLNDYQIASAAYEVQWVDGTQDVRMEEEISPITNLKMV